MNRPIVLAISLALSSLALFPTPAFAAGNDDEVHDRIVTNGSVRVAEGETVGDLVVINGDADIEGDVEGDVRVVNGNTHVGPSANVSGSVHGVNGAVVVDDGASVDGEVGAVSGTLRKPSEAMVHRTHHRSHGWSVFGVVGSIASSFVRACLFFALGVVFLALGNRRMDAMRLEMARRPMRAFAIGLCGSLLAAVIFTVLCITVIGIPFAIIGSILFTLATMFGSTAALTTAGEALLGHRTHNAYAHLAVGCALFLLVGVIPVVGHLAQVGVALTGLGLAFATTDSRFTRVEEATA